MRRLFRSAVFPILIVVVLAFFAQRLINPPPSTTPPDATATSSREVKHEPKSIKQVTLQTRRPATADVELSGRHVVLDRLPGDRRRRAVHQSADQATTSTPRSRAPGGSSLFSILTYILPFILFFGFWFFLVNQMQGGGSRVMSFGKSRAKRMSVDAPKITFRDVAGVDEAVQELQEIKEFLENPKRFQALGARIPKGVLLYGPPGTGKTLLARAVAGEAGVPFFSISGSDFVEMFVGVGASRVRDLFEQAKQNSPCIIFMDEIDAVGRHRGAGMGGGHDEREQTLNQLLVEMDGFEMKDNIILIAATNRPGHPRPGAAAARPLRPPGRRRPPRPQGPQEDPRGPHPRQAARQADRPRHARRPDPRLHRRRPRQPHQRGGAAHRALGQPRDHDEGARGGDHARDRRPREEVAA